MAISSKITLKKQQLIVTFLDNEWRIFRLLLKFSLVFTCLLLVCSSWSFVISEPIHSVSGNLRRLFSTLDGPV
jgi:hypothetical protein